MTLILAPFSMLLNLLNSIFNSYGIAIIVFAVFVKILLFPFSIKGKRGMIQMQMIGPELQRLKKQYGSNPQRYNEEVQALYLREKVNPLGGCLWTLLPMFVLLPLYAIIRQPIAYICGVSDEQLFELANTLNWDTLAVDLKMVTQDMLTRAQEKNAELGIDTGFQNTGYNQLFLASLIPDVGVTLSDGFVVAPMNFHLLGVDLTKVPNWKIWQDFSLQNFATLFLVAMSACSGFIFSKITQKTNQMNNNQPKNEQMERTNRSMMLMMPLMSIWIGLIMPSIMVVYWIANNLLSMVSEIVAGKILKKDYAHVREVQEQREREEKEAEKREKEEKVKQIEARKAELAQNKGKPKQKKKKPVEEIQDSPVDKEASREGLRTYARGRAYDPNRYPNPHDIAENTTN